ncbi:TIGR03118 family protein [Paraburkholderia youngii]|uniref:TIGR03118 family protein n=1 Tax=Paraburkholderia youngii TaxID=2782701 RepID=A0ABX2NDS1_9BURK|nr:TIGR03118 family protein [Paraburkholderia youngii]NUX55407.1 TIGR03118 family protein [Paraburkholderia youngii]NVI02446.1 TIGR03118 family protein [Paraburkholderia youngii]
MSLISRGLKAAVIMLAAGFTIGHAAADDAYVVKPLVSNVAGAAPKVDGVLQNAWGIAFSPAGSPFWINDNATGCSTLYDGEGTKVTTLQVAIPLPGNVIPAGACHPVLAKSPPNPTPAAPTGIVWNPSSAFLVPGTKIPAIFIFATEDGTISAWAGGLNPANNAVIAVDNSSNPSAANGAVYKALVFGVNAQGGFLFATNFRSGRIDVFGPNGSDGLFTPATTDGGFVDPNIPAGYAPFGIANIDGDLFVTYAKQNKEKHDDDAGRGRGFVDVFDTDGHLLRRFASRGTLDSPWGITRASFAFGRFSGKILIGNFGDGRINVFDNDGGFVDQLENEFGNPLAIDGLWTLTLGGGRNSSPDTLYFSAGPNKETNGLFGIIAPASGSRERVADH